MGAVSDLPMWPPVQRQPHKRPSPVGAAEGCGMDNPNLLQLFPQSQPHYEKKPADVLKRVTW